jgi:hypothetical protein
MNAGEFPMRSPAPVPDQRARLQSVVVNVDRSEASSIDNWREVDGSFERAIGPGLWREVDGSFEPAIGPGLWHERAIDPGLRSPFSPGLSHEPGLKGRMKALFPLVVVPKCVRDSMESSGVAIGVGEC